MDRSTLMRLAVQTGMVMPYTEDHVAFLDQFAKACCAWQKEQNALPTNTEQIVLETIVAELEQYPSLYMHTSQDGETTLDGTV